MKAMTYVELVEYIRKIRAYPSWLPETNLLKYPNSRIFKNWVGHWGMHPKLRRLILSLSTEQQIELKKWKGRQFSPKLTRWIYSNLTAAHWEDDHWTSRNLLFSLAHTNRPAPWKYSFFWNEAYRLMNEEYGMYVVETMSDCVYDYDDSPVYMDLYHEQDAHPMVRGEAIYGLSRTTRHYPAMEHLSSISHEWKDEIRDVCLEALTDQNNPYARAMACQLAVWIGEFRKEIEDLCSDETPTGEPNYRVSFYAKEALEEMEDH